MTFRFLPALAGFLLLAACRSGGTLGHEPAAPGPDLDALSLLRAREPQTAWDPKTLLRADFDGDGAEDYALGGRRGESYAVGVVRGPLGNAAQHWILEFRAGDGDQDSLCSLDVGLRVEDPDRTVGDVADLPAKAKGINLFDDECDSFHIHWSPKDRRFVWWRL